MAYQREGTPQPVVKVGADGQIDEQAALLELGLGRDELFKKVNSIHGSGTVAEMLNACPYVADALRRANQIGEVDKALVGLSMVDPNFNLERSEETKAKAESLRRQAGGKNRGFHFFG